MTYKMHNPLGEAEEVQSLEHAYDICADFVQVANTTLDRMEAATSLDEEAFATLDLIQKTWNHNVATIKQLESDPGILLAKKKAEYRKIATAIIDMANTCSERLSSSE